MKRKVIKQGNNTLTITLPSKWAEKFGIKAGDEIEVEEYGNSLKICTRKDICGRKRVLDASNLYPLVNRTLIKLYQEGLDEIELKYDEPKTFIGMQKSINECIGYEVIQQGKNYSIIKDISGLTNFNFSVTLRRLFLLIKSMMEEGYEALKYNNTEVIDTFKYRDIEINKFSNICLRYLNKIGYEDYEKTTTYFVLVSLLERIGDEYKDFFGYVKKNKVNVDKKALGILKELLDFFEKLYEFSFSLKKADAIFLANYFEKIKSEIEDVRIKNTEDMGINLFFKSILIVLIGILEIQLNNIK